MRSSRSRMAWIMVMAGFAVIDCLLITRPAPFAWAGSYLIGLSLQVGFPLMLRGRGQGRRFWVGFEATGSIALVAYIACRMAFSQVVVRWPMFLYESYRSSLSHLRPEVVDWLLGHIYVFDPRGSLTRLQILTTMEASFGLPMLLLALVGGLLTGLIGRRASKMLVGDPQKPASSRPSVTPS